MYLTKEEEHVYNGEYGWASQICMKILVRLGDLFNASRLIPISLAHVSGVSYKTLGDAAAEFLKALAEAGGKARVKATINPQSFDDGYLKKRLPAILYEKQMEIIEQFKKMGFTPSLTCTPYYIEKPEANTHLAWAESSAVVYANSVLKAWTNREGGPSALAAAIIGKTPDYGMHKPENRKPNVLVKVETSLHNEAEFGALGIYLGKILEDKIPIINGLKNITDERLKQLGAALATTGMTNMFYYNKTVGKRNFEKISVEAKDIKNTIETLSTAQEKKPDLIFLGCPHTSIHEIKKIATLINGRKIKDETELWICTSQYVKEKARKQVEKIEKSGGHVLAGVCTVVSWTEKLGIKTIMTNSAKTAYYAPMLNKAETILAPLKQCIKKAVKE